MGTLMVLSAFAIIVRPQGRRTPYNDSDLLLALDVTVEQASNLGGCTSEDKPMCRIQYYFRSSNLMNVHST